jgi:hypothetical protein
LAFFFYDVYHQVKGKKLIYLLELVVLILTAGFRYKVGGDTLAYYDYYELIPTLSQLRFSDFVNQMYQPFWYILNSFTKTISEDFYIFQFAHALIINTIMFYVIKKYTKNYFAATLIYYIFLYTYLNFEILREALSIGVFLLSLDLLLNKQYFKYFLMVLVAFGFHLSALVLFIIPIILLLMRSEKFWKIIVVFLLTFPILMNQNWLNDSFSVLSALLSSDELLLKFDNYSDLKVNFNGLIKLVFNISPVIMLLLYKHDESFAGWKKILGCYFLFLLFAFVIPGIFGRLQNYFYPLFLISIIISYESLPVVSKGNILLKKIYLHFILLFLIVNQVYYYSREVYKGKCFYQLYYPYVSVFNPYEVVDREDIYIYSLEK